MPGFYCWRCYAVNPRPTGPCEACGQEIAAPADTDPLARAVWGLGHPDPDVAVMAARRLGRRGCADAVPALRAVLDAPPDPYVAAAALRSLVELEGAEAWARELRRLVDGGPALLRATAAELLAHGPVAP